jgi:hypothetical protein
MAEYFTAKVLEAQRTAVADALDEFFDFLAGLPSYERGSLPRSPSYEEGNAEYERIKKLVDEKQYAIISELLKSDLLK